MGKAAAGGTSSAASFVFPAFRAAAAKADPLRSPITAALKRKIFRYFVIVILLNFLILIQNFYFGSCTNISSQIVFL
jgi:hypothetical protein